eukprot:12127759-Prorocentrum_lima.AAC.1
MPCHANGLPPTRPASQFTSNGAARCEKSEGRTAPAHALEPHSLSPLPANQAVAPLASASHGDSDVA